MQGGVKVEKTFFLAKDSTGRAVLKGAASVNGSEEVVVRAGFSEERGEGESGDGPIISPTLMLNWEMTDLSEQVLRDVALCEKHRFESISVRSYTRTFNPRVLVLATDGNFTKDIVATYGGVLELVPLSLDPGHPPKISPKGSGLLVEYERPLPLDPDLCTLCRSCVSVCKEDAIDSSPMIVLARCSFCNECEKVCESGAIDLHRLEKVSVEADVAIIHEDFPFEIPPELSSRFFTSATLPALFSLIGDFQVEEAVVHRVEFCAYEPRLGIGCKRCISACRHVAIVAGERGIEIRQDRCKECGACVSCCPTGAMEYERFPFYVFRDYFSRLDLAPGSHVVIGSEANLRKFWWQNPDVRFEKVFFLEHPQPASLSALHFLYLFSRGVGRVIIVPNEASGDGLSEKKAPIEEQAGLSNTILKGLFREMADFVAFEDISSVKRRLQDEIHEELALKETMPSDHLPSGNKREALNVILSHLFSGKAPNVQERLEIQEARDFADIHLKKDCCLCFSCLNVCSQDALSARGSNGLELVFERGRCINCSSCQSVCPEKAITLVPGLFLDDGYFSQKIVARDEPVQCKRCGKVFGNKKAFERTMNILRESGRYDPDQLDVLYLCEDCRAIAMLENIFGDLG